MFNDLDGFFRRTLEALRTVAASAAALRCLAGKGSEPVASAALWLWVNALLSVRPSAGLRGGRLAALSLFLPHLSLQSGILR